MPTLDVGGRAPHPVSSEWSGLSEDQVFELLLTLPTREDVERNGWSALDRLKEWARAHPDQADRVAVRNMLSSVTAMAETQRLASTPLRARGTWEVVIKLPSGREARTWIRTATVPVRVGGLSFWGVDEFPTQDPWSYRAGGYAIHYWNASDSVDLPRSGIPAMANSVPWEVAARDSVFEGVSSWLGMFEIGSATWSNAVDQELTEATSEYEHRTSAEIAEGKAYLPPVGRFIEPADGTLYFEQTVQVDTGRRFIIRARRVSLEAVAGNGYPRR
jgi:hypothetical protein